MLKPPHRKSKRPTIIWDCIGLIFLYQTTTFLFLKNNGHHLCQLFLNLIRGILYVIPPWRRTWETIPQLALCLYYWTLLWICKGFTDYIAFSAIYVTITLFLMQLWRALTQFPCLSLSIASCLWQIMTSHCSLHYEATLRHTYLSVIILTQYYAIFRYSSI